MLTKEQQQVVNAEDNEIFVSARAGTGKTTTLKEFANIRNFKIILYLVYNSAIRSEASKKFPSNVEVHTSHSLSFKHIGIHYKDKFKQNLNLFDIIYNVPRLKKKYFLNKNDMNVFKEARLILENLKTFFFTANGKLTNQDAKKYWDKMQDLTNKEVKMTFDGFLKLFQMSKIELKYDYILIDEAQDLNEVMLDIVNTQNCQKVFVGDPYQSIYGYQNLVNVFENKDNLYSLTQTFRFGENIASLVNTFMISNFHNYIPIKSNPSIKDLLYIPMDKKFVTITRTNAHLFDLVAQSVFIGKQVHIIGSFEEVLLYVHDGYLLYIGQISQIRNPNIRELGSFKNLQKIVKATEDQEFKYLEKIINKYKSSLVDVIERIRKYHVKEKNADIIFSTTHKSKGREFEYVSMARDFPSFFDKDGDFKRPDSEEINIYYVAMTRAIYGIRINENVNNYLKYIANEQKK